MHDYVRNEVDTDEDEKWCSREDEKMMVYPGAKSPFPSNTHHAITFMV